MAETNVFPASLIGKTFDCVFGPFVPRLTFFSPEELHLQASIGVTEIDEVVKVDLTSVRPNLVLVSWTEQSGNFVVQLQDHENGTVHNYARLADGQLFCAQGAIQFVPVA
ncbi:MoaF-related domain-containing protein [Mesorhizobium sp. Root695]|uniref:MoaF-related domain-containing protein n=1 Tax=Mesorhizobium sp. Root695 TaxID=1736589 RepID=UPI000AAF03DE|nr:hypothetical protein [Mesorhizobium sp. Root695]